MISSLAMGKALTRLSASGNRIHHAYSARVVIKEPHVVLKDAADDRFVIPRKSVFFCIASSDVREIPALDKGAVLFAFPYGFQFFRRHFCSPVNMNLCEETITY